MLIEETTVPDGALPVEDFKAHLRLGTGFVEDTVQDDVLRGFLRAALAAIEGRTGRALFERSFRLDVSAWGRPDAQNLPVTPVASVAGIEIVDASGGRSVVSAETYWLEHQAAQPRIRALNGSLPTIPRAGRAEVQFFGGFGLAWTDIPVDLRQAVMLLASHYYEYRNETSLGDGCMPFGVTSLIERYKTMRLYAGGAR